MKRHRHQFCKLQKQHILWGLFAVFICLSDVGYGQDSISGTITDANTGDILSGVTVGVKGRGTGALSDAEGHYRVDASSSDSLIFSFVGYSTKTIFVGNQSLLDVELMPINLSLDQLVVVGYGKQKKSDITGSIASIDGDDIVKSSNTNITNSFAGRLPGITAVKGNGKPGESSQLSIRGISTFGDNSALVVIDGIIRTIDQVNPNDIESVSILKDASATAVYGSRAANGVILITTKRGRSGKPTISYDGYVGFQQPTVYPKLMNGEQFAITRNVARANTGLSPYYSEDEIKEIKNGEWEETDWYDATLEKAALQTSHNISIRGGSDKVDYFVSSGFIEQGGLYESLNYKRYNVLSNVDVHINPLFTASVGVDASRSKNKGSGYSPEQIFRDILAGYPFDLTNNPDGSIFYTEEQHPVEEIKTGYDRSEKDQVQVTLDLKHELPFIDGLSIAARVSFGKESVEDKLHQAPILMDRQDDQGNTLEIYPFGGFNGKAAVRQSISNYNTTLLNYSLNYNRTFNEVHSLKVIALFEQLQASGRDFFGFRTNFPNISLDQLLFGGDEEKDANGSSFYDGRKSYVVRADYNYKEKYFIEGSMRVDGSVAFPTSKRYGYFPAVSAGWRLSEEEFMKGGATLNFINNLKLRASYGLVGNDRNVYSGRVPTFQYQQVYNLGGPMIFGGDVTQTINPGVLPNPNVTWESAAIMDIGLEGSLFENKLDFELDYFHKNTRNILLARERSIPETLGAQLPAENYAKVNNSGFEVSLTHNNRLGEFHYFVRGNMSYSNNKVILIDEPANIDDFLRQTGRPLGFIVGYQALGYFQTDKEVQDYYPQFNGGQEAGDVKYADLNGDHVINTDDRKVLSKNSSTSPKIIYGLTLGGNFKGFDFNILFQGAALVDKMLNGHAITFFNGGSHNNFAALLDYWTPDNPNATYPRPWQNANPNNNRESSLYLRDASYLRWKSANVGYTFKKSFLNSIGLESLRVFISGDNLMLFDKLHLFDPEVENTDGSYYPQQRSINFGVNLTF